MAYRGKHSQSAGSEHRVRFDGQLISNISLEPLTSSFLGKLTADDDDDDE
jgi:hypothetical protein